MPRLAISSLAEMGFHHNCHNLVSHTVNEANRCANKYRQNLITTEKTSTSQLQKGHCSCECLLI
jgi:hypothetical protein